MIGRTMIPVLTGRGKLVLASGVTFVAVGALRVAPPLVALGGIILSALLTIYLWFFPVGILLRRKKIELSWWVPPGDQPGGALSVERPFSLHVAFRNHGRRALRLLSVDILGSEALDLPDTVEVVVPPRRQVLVIGEVRSRSAGYQVLHGAVLCFGDALGLLDVRAYFPNPLAMKVFPRYISLASQILRPQGGAQQEQAGLHQTRRRGLAGELREIRDHVPGDSFKYIAWKATGRRRKLMVRELETELVMTHQILVDIGGSMRMGSPGRTKLDYALDTAAALARSALDGGDRVGLIAFDSRVYSELRPGSGHHHFLKLVDRLIETHHVVDEDLTDLTNGELIATVARYMAYQEALDVRLREAPPLDDAQWQHLQAGPKGDLYDMNKLSQVVGPLLKAMGQMRAHKSSAPAWWWSRVQVSPESGTPMARLRLFCRLRGIELPYRFEPGSGRRAAGLARAIDRIGAHGRADVIVLISDLQGLADRVQVTRKALVTARRGGQRVVAIAPFGPAFAPEAKTEIGHQVSRVLMRDEEQAFKEGRRVLVSQGIPVIEAGPGDSPSVLLPRVARARVAMRRLA